MSEDPGWTRVPPTLLAAEIQWIADLDNQFLYQADFGGKRWSLRINDFPDEVPFSLMVDNGVVAEFDDRPAGWQLRREFES